MTEEEKLLLEQTKREFGQQELDNKKDDQATEKIQDIDVDALLRMHGLTHDMQPTDVERKWKTLAVVTVVLIIGMVAISIFLSQLTD